MNQKRVLIVEKRKVFRMGGSLMIGLPPEFTRIHNIKEGDELPVLANHIIKIVPMSEGIGFPIPSAKRGRPRKK